MDERNAGNQPTATERACDACRIRKLKCSMLLEHKATAEPCVRCAKTGVMCTYNAPPRKRGPATGKRLSALRNSRPPPSEPIVTPIASTSVLPEPSTPLPAVSHYPAEPTPQEIVDDFFDYGYATFPILDRETMMTRVAEEHHLVDPAFRTLLVGTATFNEACALRSNPLRGESKLLHLAQRVEKDRGHYDFVDCPTLDTIATSLFLFVAYNVMGRHNRAFLYLTEAIGLRDLIDEPFEERERIRLTRIEYVIFVTESASISIYGNGKRRLARRPENIVQSADVLRMPSRRWRDARTEEDSERLDREAAELLLLMTRLHAATDINEIISVAVTPSDAPNAAVRFGHKPVYPTQSADVAITQQWMLARQLPLLFNSCQTNPLAITGLAMTLQTMGSSVMQWISGLQSGQLRIVGLGKVTAIAQTIHTLAAQLGEEHMFGNILRDLVFTVANNDSEGNFVPLLSDCIAKFYRDLPPRMSNGLPEPFHVPFGQGLLPAPQEEQGSAETEVILESAPTDGLDISSVWLPTSSWDPFNMPSQSERFQTPNAMSPGEDAQLQASIASLLGV